MKILKIFSFSFCIFSYYYSKALKDNGPKNGSYQTTKIVLKYVALSMQLAKLFGVPFFATTK